MATLTKAELVEIIGNFTSNIEDRLINPYINKAFELDFTNVLPQTLLDAMEAFSLSAASEKKTFYQDHFRVCWAYRAYGRFLANHGNNVTQFGIAQVTDLNTMPVDSKSRGMMIAQNDRDASVYFNKMIQNLESKNWVLDSVTYSFSTTEVQQKPSKKFGIRAIN